MILGDDPGSGAGMLKDFIFHFGELAGALVFGMLIGVVSIIKKNKIMDKWSAKTEASKITAHTRVHESLTELRVMVRAGRALIFQYHNGGKFADGTSIKRFSVTHESCSTGIMSMMMESQDVLLTRYMELISLIDEKPNKIIAVSSLPDCSFRSILEINNVVYFSVGSLKCEDGLTPMGFVCCHWCDVTELDKLHEEGFDDDALQDVIKNSIHTINNHLIHTKTT
jgi:hypothetical protein